MELHGPTTVRSDSPDFPGRQVVQLNVDHLHGGGGGIHCVTQQEPLV